MSDKLELSLDIKQFAAEVAKYLLPIQANESLYYSSTNNPLGRRRFLECARNGDFPTFSVDKRGKLLALRSDVDGWIQSQRREVNTGDEGDDIDRALSRVVTYSRECSETEQ